VWRIIFKTQIQRYLGYLRAKNRQRIFIVVKVRRQNHMTFYLDTVHNPTPGTKLFGWQLKTFLAHFILWSLSFSTTKVAIRHDDIVSDRKLSENPTSTANCMGKQLDASLSQTKNVLLVRPWLKTF